MSWFQENNSNFLDNVKTVVQLITTLGLWGLLQSKQHVWYISQVTTVTILLKFSRKM